MNQQDPAFSSDWWQPKPFDPEMFKASVKTLGDLIDEDERTTWADLARNWGGWQLDVEHHVLVLRDPTGREWYDIDLEGCVTSAQVLDRICQVKAKLWSADVVVAGLVRALDDILGPQERLCSWGRSMKLTKDQIRTLVNARRAE
ncbi:hypothetical protein ACFYO8_10675 [Micromonospora sp. NPDC005257]|uniref:hypothetical protein n=1 Tax=Micromonospora sp. NPDC005257 TaxID=3364230 RepID=UPI00368F882F